MTSIEVIIGAVAFCLLFVAGFLAMAETSLSRIDRVRAQVLASNKRRGASALVQIVEVPERFSGYLNSVLLLLLATQITASTLVAYLLFHWVSGPWFVVAVIAEIFIGYVVAEAMPKTWAVQHTERSALWCAPVIVTLARVIPMRTITGWLITAANVMVPGRGLAQGPFVFEQQILALADNAAKQNVIERAEHELIHSVIEFGTTIAREVMIPRTDMVTISYDAQIAEAMELVIVKGVSRVPVHGDESDEIVGMIFAKDLMSAVHGGRGNEGVVSIVRPAMFVPETKRVAELMREMQRDKFHMAMVVDEYGTIVGLATLEDLVEEVVGEITDEYDIVQHPRVEALGEGRWRIDARTQIDDVESEIGVSLPRGDWDTLGGLLINAFGRVPARGESIDVGELHIAVEQTSGRRVTRLRLEIQK